MKKGILRPATTSDEQFLRTLYTDTRANEMKQVPWSDEQKTAFITMQFDAQDKYYKAQYPQANYDIIEYNQQAVGRLYVHRARQEIRIIDIALLTDYCNKGIGSGLLQNILSEAQKKQFVTIHVESQNPAIALYQRLGFEKKGDTGVYWFMEWQPTGTNHDN